MATDLVTLAEYKAYAGITSDTLDTIVTAIIPKVSQLVKTLCRRTFVDYISDPKAETFSGSGNERLLLKEYPILQVYGVEYSTDFGLTYTDLVEYTDYVLDAEDGSIVAISGGVPATFTNYVNGYKVTYTAGYETLPDDLKVAALDLVTYYVKNDASVHSPKAPGTNTVQIEYITSTSLPAHIKRILDLYTASFD